MDGGAGLNAKRLQILKEIVPTAMRIAFVTSRRQEVEALGVPILERLLADVTEAELGRALDEMVREKIDAVLVSQGGDFLAQRTLIVELAAKHRLPAMYPYRDYVDLAGSLPMRHTWANSPSEWPPTCSKSSTAPRPAIFPSRNRPNGDDDQPQDGQGAGPHCFAIACSPSADEVIE